MSVRITTSDRIGLTAAMIEVLYKMLPPGYVASGRAIELRQTWTDSGGTHCYVTILDDTYHISQAGVVRGPLLPEERHTLSRGFGK